MKRVKNLERRRASHFARNTPPKLHVHYSNSDVRTGSERCPVCSRMSDAEFKAFQADPPEDALIVCVSYVEAPPLAWDGVNYEPEDTSGSG